MGKIYASYDEYLQDAYEEQMDRYTNSNNVIGGSGWIGIDAVNVS